MRKSGYVPHRPIEKIKPKTANWEIKRLTLNRWVASRSDNFFVNLINPDESPFTVDGRLNHQCHR